jgi:hypothetical protein
MTLRGADWVLLTAAVSPATAIRVAVSDVRERQAQYRLAFSWWSAFCAKNSYRLLVVETSGADAETVLPTNADVSWLSYDAVSGLAERGKGAIESAALDHALAHLATQDQSSRTVHKVTGRLRISNADKVLRSHSVGEISIRRTIDRRYVDTRLLSFTIYDWQNNFREMYSEVEDPKGRYLEHVFARRLAEAEYARRLRVSAFRSRPMVEGVSGSTGARYGKGRNLSAALNLLMDPIEKTMLTRLSDKQV